MISDETVKQLFEHCRGLIPDQYWQEDWQEEAQLLPSQFYRGGNPRVAENIFPINCGRHGSVFSTYNIIPRYCFNCYKVSIEPRNAVELLKLMVVFDRLDLPNDNSRKCMVEMRPYVSGAYKGLIYVKGIEDAKQIREHMQHVIAEEISAKVSVSLKRGCSEYALAYPEYSKFDENGDGVMEYKPEWQEYEDLADRMGTGAQFEPPPDDTLDPAGFNSNDALAMLVWLKYAATIGDSSYSRIIEFPISKLEKMPPRPPFRPIEDE